VQVYKCSVASALENAAYLLFYVKQGSSPWFSTLLEKEDKCPLDGSVSLEEQGEIALVNKEERHLVMGKEMDLLSPTKKRRRHLLMGKEMDLRCQTYLNSYKGMEMAIPCRMHQINWKKVAGWVKHQQEHKDLAVLLDQATRMAMPMGVGSHQVR